MTDEIKEQLNTKISDALNNLDLSNMGSEECKTSVDCVVKLIDKRNEMDKIDIEEKRRSSNEEIELRKQYLSEQAEENRLNKDKELQTDARKDRIINYAISIGSIVIPVCLTVWGTYKTFKFEETGTVTTSMGRGFINRLFPKK